MKTLKSVLFSVLFAMSFASPARAETLDSLQKLFREAQPLKKGELKTGVSYTCAIYEIGNAGLSLTQVDDAMNLIQQEGSDILMNGGRGARHVGFRPEAQGYMGMNPISPWYVYLKKTATGALVGELFVNTAHGSVGRDEVLPGWPQAISSAYFVDERARGFRAHAYEICTEN